MGHRMIERRMRLVLVACLAAQLAAAYLGAGAARAQANTPVPSAPTQPSGQTGASPPPATSSPSTSSPSTSSPATPSPATPGKAPDVAPQAPALQPPGKALAPEGTPNNTEIERNAAPGIPGNATTENVEVPARSVAMLKGQSSYDDAFKSIKTSIDTVKAAMDKAGLKPTGHPITVFSEPDVKGFKYQAAIPIAALPPGNGDLGSGVMVAQSPSGKAIKFQHRGAYEDIDSTYDVITAYLDAKGMQVDNPYIEEYLTDLTTADDPNLQIDIYVFIK